MSLAVKVRLMVNYSTGLLTIDGLPEMPLYSSERTSLSYIYEMPERKDARTPEKILLLPPHTPFLIITFGGLSAVARLCIFVLKLGGT